MLVFLTTIFGFFNSIAPELLKKWQDTSDKKHELEIIKLQMEQQAKGYAANMEAAGLSGYYDVVKSALADQTQQVANASLWVRNLSASVRPVVTYIFLIAFIFFKLCIFWAAINPTLPWQGLTLKEAALLVWGEDELALLGYIFGYYFGDRTLARAKK